MADKLAQIKLECLAKILKQIKDNDYQMLDNNDIVDNIMSFSQDLPDSSDFAELGAWIKDRCLMIPMALEGGFLDATMKEAEKILGKKKSFLSSIFG